MIEQILRENAMVDMKGAVRAAMVFAKDMFPEVKDIRLEEVEPSSNGWSVVVSFATDAPATYAIVTGRELPRVYKTVAIESDGQPSSLKVWNQ
jgi:hypothetical protein